MIESSSATELNAIGLSDQIDLALQRWSYDNSVNDLPDELQVFQSVSILLREVGSSLASVRTGAEKSDKIVAELEKKIFELQLQIMELIKQLDDSRSKEVHGLVAQGFYRTLGATTCAALCTSIVSTASYFIIPEHAPDIIKSLGDKLLNALYNS